MPTNMFRESVEPAMRGFWRSRWFILTIVIVVLIPSLLMLILRLDFGQREMLSSSTFPRRNACLKYSLNLSN
jgi:hypothetical protein